MGIKGQKWIEKLSKAELYCKENPNVNWEDILKRIEFVEETSSLKLTLGEELTNVTIMNYGNGNYSYIVMFLDGSFIDLYEKSNDILEVIAQ